MMKVLCTTALATSRLGCCPDLFITDSFPQRRRSFSECRGQGPVRIFHITALQPPCAHGPCFISGLRPRTLFMQNQASCQLFPFRLPLVSQAHIWCVHRQSAEAFCLLCSLQAGSEELLALLLTGIIFIIYFEMSSLSTQ